MEGVRAPAGFGGAPYALAAVAVALFGLLSMHGWGSHTGGHSMGAIPQSANVTIVTSDLGGHGHSGAPATEPDSSTQVVAGLPTGVDHQEPGNTGAGLLGLCLAVLTGLVLGIALLLARRGIRIPRTRLPAWRSPVFIGRDRDPPSLRMLCVIRC